MVIKLQTLHHNKTSIVQGGHFAANIDHCVCCKVY